VNSDISKIDNFPNADYIIHAASIASPIFYRKFPLETIDANLYAYHNLLRFYKDKDIKSMLYFSTSEIYGDPPEDAIPTPETFWGHVNCTGPRACYDESKRMGETLSVLFHQLHQTPVKIVRPFNNYGPGLSLNDRRVIPDFFKNIINNHDVELFSNGKATRTFCYIEDAMVGYLLVLLSDHNATPFNIGTANPEISILDLANLCIEISGKNNLSVKYVKSLDESYVTDNPNRRCPNIDKATSLIGYNPEVSLKDGLSQTYEFYSSTWKK
jgi:dTDP-glucose 4,6-dehydratase/UDP-glucuronate decarboxylase